MRRFLIPGVVIVWLAAAAAVALVVFGPPGRPTEPVVAPEEPVCPQGVNGERSFLSMEYTNTETHGWRSFLNNGQQLTHVEARWLHLRQAGGASRLETDVDPNIVAEGVRSCVAVIPILDNLERPLPESLVPQRARVEPVRDLLGDTTQRSELVRTLVTTMTTGKFSGIEVDFAGLDVSDRPLVTTFVRELRNALRPVGKIVIVSSPVDVQNPAGIAELAQMAEEVDFVRARIVADPQSLATPGPPASPTFFRSTLDAVVAAIPARKLIIGIATVGNDFEPSGDAREIAFPRAMALAIARQGTIQWDQELDSLVLTYVDEGVSRRAFFDDTLTLSNKMNRIEALQLAGVSIGRLGTEDPSLWQRFIVGGSPEGLRELTTVDAADFQVLGAGEVWDAVTSATRQGRREFAIDPTTATVSAIRYVDLPTPYIIDRVGVPPGGKKIALTFDDGPSREWTPRVLDLLSEYQVPATFFVVGRHALANRDLLPRIVREGHELGSHTLTHTALAQMSAGQLVWELNATRYIVAGATGRNLRYIRSPFVANPSPADEGPTTEPGDFLLPLLRAKQFGYLTVGNNLDPRDWERPGVGPIVAAATNRGLNRPSHIILMHDSGGDRSQTLQALPVIIDFYRSEGFEFTTVSGLLGRDRDFGMPPVLPGEEFPILFVSSTFNALQTAENAFGFLLLFGIGVSVFRTGTLMTLAIIHYKKPRPEPFKANEIQPFVSVLVPAYNEEKVIGNTIDSLLASTYRNYEVIVIDDGSKDGTLAAARRYEGNPRVRVIAKENGGKSSALNRGILEAKGEVVIAMDADTVFDPNFIPYVLGHFRDPNVGAASGNAKVGNREDLMANFQSIEYITSFNLDRRAYTLINCVTVVPGAAGAWRKRDLVAAGGFKHDTLAEDADLTVNVRRMGRRIVYEERALAWTEAPNTAAAFVKQRKRWSFGTLQMMAKHRDVFFRPKYGTLGFVAFPSAILYLLLSIVAPAIDLGALITVTAQVFEQTQLNRETPMPPGDFALSLFWGSNGGTPLLFYLAFILLEWIMSCVAFWMDREDAKALPWVPIQRFVLRWLMYWVLFVTLINALKGLRMGWGKLERKGSVLGSTGGQRA